MEIFDASTPPADDKSTAEVLDELESHDSTTRLLNRLDEIDELVERILEEDAGQPLDPDIVAALEQVTGAPDAPAVFRRLFDRVRDGKTTWEQFWADPGPEPGGMSILQAAIQQSARDIGKRMAELADWGTKK